MYFFYFYIQTCRLAFELMQLNYMDTSKMFYSLDIGYIYRNSRRQFFVATQGHKANSNEEISFNVGNKIEILSNGIDGWSVGRRVGSTKKGLLPSYKVKELIDVQDFPIYSEIV